jgi:MoxR-like ATPase
MLGGPGIAKSQLADRTFLRIAGATYGKFPMNRLMSADDLFGPVDVEAYAERRRYRRVLEGYLGAVEYANLEEIFKSGPSTLGLLLSALNERTIRDDGAMKQIPLRVMICSSNELPKDDITAPLYDRIPLRYQVEAPQDKAAIQRMLELVIVPADQVDPVLTGEELHQAQAAAAALPFAPQVTEKLTDLYVALFERGIRPTPRRLRWTMKAMQAEAWLDGSDIVAVEHMSIAAHCLWDLPAQAGDVEEAVLELANPLERRTLSLLDDVAGIRKMLAPAIASPDEEERQARGMEVYYKISEVTTELNEVIATGGTGRRQRELIDSARDAIHGVLVDLCTKGSPGER